MKRSSPSGPESSSNPSLLWTPLFVIAAVAFAVEIPFFFLGTPNGHDIDFHLYSWLDVLGQWRHGILYPRWASQAHFGYGEPRFLFYPPASWMLGAALSAFIRFTHVLAVYIWVALSASGVTMFLAARRWFNRRDAIFAAALYAVNPYHLVIVYWRSAFAELLAACLIPLLLLFLLRAADDTQRSVANKLLPIALVLAAAWLTNAPAAIMIHYSLALLIVFLAWRRRSPRLLLIGAGAVALGACLSAFYLLPAVYEQKWIHIRDALAPGFRPQDSFLFCHTPNADHDIFNRVVSWVAILEMTMIGFSAGLARQWREKQRELWSALLLWALAASVLLFPFTAVLWHLLPKLAFMQFPWRWLLCLSLAFALFVTAGLERWWHRGAVCALSLFVLLLLGHRLLPPFWYDAGDFWEVSDNMEAGTGYENKATVEYVPIAANASAIIQDKDDRNVRVEGPARANIRVLRWDAEQKDFIADMSAADQLKLKLFFYPAWKVEVNGHAVDTPVQPNTGQMLVPVASGTNHVTITFVRTWDRLVGGWLSLISAIAVVAWLWLDLRHKT
jgi:hypothetical protein